LESDGNIGDGASHAYDDELLKSDGDGDVDDGAAEQSLAQPPELPPPVQGACLPRADESDHNSDGEMLVSSGSEFLEALRSLSNEDSDRAAAVIVITKKILVDVPSGRANQPTIACARTVEIKSSVEGEVREIRFLFRDLAHSLVVEHTVPGFEVSDVSFVAIYGGYGVGDDSELPAVTFVELMAATSSFLNCTFVSGRSKKAAKFPKGKRAVEETRPQLLLHVFARSGEHASCSLVDCVFDKGVHGVRAGLHVRLGGDDFKGRLLLSCDGCEFKNMQDVALSSNVNCTLKVRGSRFAKIDTTAVELLVGSLEERTTIVDCQFEDVGNTRRKTQRTAAIWADVAGEVAIEGCTFEVRACRSLSPAWHDRCKFSLEGIC
jgi:hypothetical protein